MDKEEFQVLAIRLEEVNPIRGTGGLLVLFVSEVGCLGKLSSEGSNAGTRFYDSSIAENRYSGGGPSGGGSINVFSTMDLSNTDFTGFSVKGGTNSLGGHGGKGTVSVGTIVDGLYCEKN